MEKWQLLHSDTLISNQWLTIFKNQYQVTENQVIDDYYIIKRKNFVLIIAVEDDKLILVRQYRPATDRFYLSLPAGYLELNELPEEGARRELLEETGFRGKNFRVIGELHSLPGYVHSIAFVVFCEVISAMEAKEIDNLEISETLEMKWEKVFRLIAKGDINEMQAVAAILLAKETLFQATDESSSVA